MPSPTCACISVPCDWRSNIVTRLGSKSACRLCWASRAVHANGSEAAVKKVVPAEPSETCTVASVVVDAWNSRLSVVPARQADPSAVRKS